MPQNPLDSLDRLQPTHIPGMLILSRVLIDRTYARRKARPMNNPLYATAEEATMPIPAGEQEALEHPADEESHIHLPNPSFWPILISLAIAVTLGGVLFISSAPWITAVGLIFVLITAVGWALENPMAPFKEKAAPAHMVISYEEAMETGRPTALAEAVLQDAEEVAERVVTVSSTEWSAHPVHIEIEREGVILALYGKVELEAQRKTLEEELLKLPGVIDVRNFLVAEDEILNAVNARIENLRAAGKLEGAKNISALVENYIVNLYGEVPTNEMKYRLERELISIPGVRVVVNRINLGDIPGDLGKTRNRVGPG
jgi:BON domain